MENLTREGVLKDKFPNNRSVLKNKFPFTSGCVGSFGISEGNITWREKINKTHSLQVQLQRLAEK